MRQFIFALLILIVSTGNARTIYCSIQIFDHVSKEMIPVGGEERFKKIAEADLNTKDTKQLYRKIRHRHLSRCERKSNLTHTNIFIEFKFNSEYSEKYQISSISRNFYYAGKGKVRKFGGIRPRFEAYFIQLLAKYKLLDSIAADIRFNKES